MHHQQTMTKVTVKNIVTVNNIITFSDSILKTLQMKKFNSLLMVEELTLSLSLDWKQNNMSSCSAPIWNLFAPIWNPCLDFLSFCPDLKFLKLLLYVIPLAPICSLENLARFLIPLLPPFVIPKIYASI